MDSVRHNKNNSTVLIKSKRWRWWYLSCSVPSLTAEVSAVPVILV